MSGRQAGQVQSIKTPRLKIKLPYPKLLQRNWAHMYKKKTDNELFPPTPSRVVLSFSRGKQQQQEAYLRKASVLLFVRLTKFNLPGFMKRRRLHPLPRPHACPFRARAGD